MNINPSCMSVGELIHYVSNGTIESLDSEQVMRLVVHFEEEIEGLKWERDQAYDDGKLEGYYEGYNVGYEDGRD